MNETYLRCDKLGNVFISCCLAGTRKSLCNNINQFSLSLFCWIFSFTTTSRKRPHWLATRVVAYEIDCTLYKVVLTFCTSLSERRTELWKWKRKLLLNIVLCKVFLLNFWACGWFLAVFKWMLLSSYFLRYYYIAPEEGVLLGILGWGVPPGSPNPDPISDQKCHFSHPFSDPDPFSDTASKKFCHHYLEQQQ